MVKRFSWTVRLNLKTFFVDSKDFVVSAPVPVQLCNINNTQLKDAEVKKLSRHLTDGCQLLSICLHCLITTRSMRCNAGYSPN